MGADEVVFGCGFPPDAMGRAKTVYDEMRSFTAARTAVTADELWCVEHPPVFTQGQAGKPEQPIKRIVRP